MHPRVFQEFERICSARNIRGSVLEVGAIPSRLSLLCMKSLEHAEEKVGLNLDGPYDFRDFTIRRGNANAMDLFEDERFDLVLCNSLLEHDKYFWRTVAEMRRVTTRGGAIVIGTPGYRRFKAEKVQWFLARMPGVRRLILNQYLNALFAGTITYRLHNEPGDYYRFSPQTYREVFLAGMDNVEVRSIMLPPRIIGVGTKRDE